MFNHLSSRALSCIPGCHYLSPATSTYLRSLYLIISYFSYCCHFFYDCHYLSLTAVIYLRSFSSAATSFSWLRSFSSDAGCQHFLRMLAVIIFSIRMPSISTSFAWMPSIPKSFYPSAVKINVIKVIWGDAWRMAWGKAILEDYTVFDYTVFDGKESIICQS